MTSRYHHFFCCLFFSLLSFTVCAQISTPIRPEGTLPALLINGNAIVELNRATGGMPLSAVLHEGAREKSRVRFVELTVKKSGNKPQVTWQVTDEEEVSHYSIERSYNGSFFEEGGKVPFVPATSAYNTYTFRDNNVAEEEEVYYRVKQVDSSGRYLYSQIVSLRLAQSSAIQLVPNPANDKTTVQVESNKGQAGWLQLVDPSGAVVLKQSITLKKGSNKLTLDGLQQFGNGTYYVQVVLPGGILYKKLLLQ